jgi:murein DD-endopeptidase MepM/ murein hydrolase activator NlpD
MFSTGKGLARRGALIAMLGGALITAFPSASATASSYSQRQEQLQELIQQKQSKLHSLNHQRSNLLDQIQASDVQLASIQRRMNALTAALADARGTLAQIDAHLNAVTVALQTKNAQLEATMGELAARQAAMNERVAEIYMGTPTSYTEALSEAQDFNDVVAANQFASSVIRADQATVTRLEQTEAKIAAQRGDISVQQAELVAARNSATVQAQKIASLTAQQSAVQAQEQQVRALQHHYLTLVNAQRNNYIRAINQLKAENAAITSLLLGAQRGQNVVQGVGGYLKWPVSGPITSPFGWRIHPIYHYRSFHTGIDIGVATGTIVKAARHGTVLFTGYDGAYGLIVIIDHGGQLATVYAHLSRVFVSKGEHVGTLSSIAASGNTGWSTGPHLHFEVRSQGVPVNPIGWL